MRLLLHCYYCYYTHYTFSISWQRYYDYVQL